MATRRTYHVVWTEAAWREVESAASYIAQDSRRYAEALVSEVRSAARTLRHSPSRGRAVPEFGAGNPREIFVKSYRLIYDVRKDSVMILAFIHGSRNLSIYLD